MADTAYILGLLAVAGGVTILLRALPFLLLGNGKKPAPAVEYIGRMLAPAAIAMLAVYCLSEYFSKTAEQWDWSVSSWSSLAAPAAASAVVVGLQCWKRNSLTSIIAGTVVYMLIVQLF